MRETTVALGLNEELLQTEVLHFLERLPSARVVGASEAIPPLRRLLQDQQPDAVVGAPHLLRGLDHPAKLAIATRETTDVLRASIQAGARGFFVWPTERDALARELQRLGPVVSSQPGDRGVAVSVLGARGGAGATFLATNLAAAFAARAVDTVLVDLDLVYGDLTPALGMATDVSLPSVLDLAAVAGELTAEHVDRAVHPHPAGFHVVLAPPSPVLPGTVDALAVAATVRALRLRFDVVILHLARAVDAPTRAALEASDAALLVVTPDVLAVRGAKRLVGHLQEWGVTEKLRLVVNKASRGEVIPDDVRDVLSLPVAAVLSPDRAVERAQNRGELIVRTRRRLPRRIDRIAGTLLEAVSA